MVVSMSAARRDDRLGAPPPPAVTAATSAIASRKRELRGLRENRDGKLIATAQATLDGAIDPVGVWVQADGDYGDYSFERQARSGGLVLGRKTYEGLAAYWPGQTGEKGLIDEYEAYLNPLVWGQRCTRRCPDAGALTNGPTKAS